jgi:hypothetical protein
MYLFETAYHDYLQHFTGFFQFAFRCCGATWSYFWSGPAARFFDVVLKLAVIVSGITLAFLYVRYEQAAGRGVSVGLFTGAIFTMVYSWILLWPWKGPVHFAARAASGTTAAATMLGLALLALIVAAVTFGSYLLLLVILTALSFLVFVPMRVSHWLWLKRRDISFVCPNDLCPSRDERQKPGHPIHECDCGHEYADLYPSFYGIFHHTCRHRDGRIARLPTLGILGRNKLPRKCPHCRHPLPFTSLGELGVAPIAVVGGTSTGKSVFVRQAIRSLKSTLERSSGNRVELDSPEQWRKLKQDWDDLDHGRELPKTIGDVVQAIGLAMRLKRPRTFRKLVYLFDTPGEHFATIERFGRKQVIRHVSGILLLIDPFSLERLANHARRLHSGVRPSPEPLENVVATLVGGVRQLKLRQSNGRCDVPLAVVVAKADALPVADFPFLSGLLPANGQAGADHSARCRQAIIDLGAGNTLRTLELNFNRIRYFAGSAQGRTYDARDSTPFTPVAVADPFLWLLDLTHPLTSNRGMDRANKAADIRS